MLTQLNQICNELVFKVKPADFTRRMEDLRSGWFENNGITSKTAKMVLMRELAEITLDLHSYLIKWSLQRPGSVDFVKDDELAQEIKWNYQLLLCNLGQDAVDNLKKEAKSITQSNLAAITLESAKGNLNTYWGNDYASGLRQAMRRGAILATTNPQLVNMARKEEPEYWSQIRDNLIQKHPDYSLEQLGAAMTIEVILENAWELRPIYEVSEGKFGYVSLQVNPNNAFNSEGMIKEAFSIYAHLEEKMGCTPNVVFKVPGTSAGLPVVKELTSKGIGVNVTVNFTVAQQLAFAKAIEGGTAKTSFLTEMNGRLDDMVYEELEGLGVVDAREVSTWAGVAVTRQAYSMLYTGDDAYSRSALLVASLRGPWHIERSLMDGKVPLYITVFPDKAKAYDEKPRKIRPFLHEEIPKEVLYKLKKSQTFLNAYEPDKLTVSKFDTYEPVKATLDGFSKSYDDFLGYFKQ